MQNIISAPSIPIEFLLQEYPASKYREDALLAIAHIQQDDLHDAALARKTYEQFLSLHPRSTHAAEVRAAIDKLDKADKDNAQNAAARSSQPSIPVSAPPSRKIARIDSLQKRSRPRRLLRRRTRNRDRPTIVRTRMRVGPRVSRIRTWNADTYTRIVIDVGSKVKYQAARISGPDRIYFDIEGAKLNSALLHKPIDLDGGGFLKTVRVAQNHSGVVRVVLEVNRVKDYSVFLLPDPYRLVVDVYGTSAAAETASRDTAPPAEPATTDEPAVKPEKPGKEISAKTSPKRMRNWTHHRRPKQRLAIRIRARTPSPRQSSVRLQRTRWRSRTPPLENRPVVHPVIPGRIHRSPPASELPPKEINRKTIKPTAPTLSASANTADTEILPLPSHPAWPKKSSHAKKSAHDQAEEMGPPPIPDLTLDGQHSLTRALGLKIGRIVIDAGHGGHDTGTIGPTGLMEKDLCLDVALRLGKIIQQRLPSAEVVFTRNDDTFIPLERRTEIANEAKADLFISVHANSSQDHQARGIETYYLNFTGSSDAMEVASRENALSENGVHDLQDIVKKIASNEKIEESRDFAAMIQDSLSKRMENLNRGERNRGVRKAPFVVLIGADMPSVLWPRFPFFPIPATNSG